MMRKIWYNPHKRRIFLLCVLFLCITITVYFDYKKALTGILQIGFFICIFLLCFLIPGSAKKFFLENAEKFYRQGRLEMAVEMLERALDKTKVSADPMGNSLIAIRMSDYLRKLSKRNNNPYLLERAIYLREQTLPVFYEKYPEAYISILSSISEYYLKLAYYQNKVENISKSIIYLSKVTEYLIICKFSSSKTMLVDIKNDLAKVERFLILKAIPGFEDNFSKAWRMLENSECQAALLLDRLDSQSERNFRGLVLMEMGNIHIKMYEMLMNDSHLIKAFNEMQSSIEAFGCDRQSIRSYKSIYCEMTGKIAAMRNILLGSASKAIKCIACGNSFNAVNFYPVCKKCNSNIFKNRIPTMIKVISLVILAIFIYSSMQVPSVISSGVSYARGISAEKQHRYNSSSKEYEKVLKCFPGSVIIESRLFVSYIKGEQYEKAKRLYNSIGYTGNNRKRLDNEARNAIRNVSFIYNSDKRLDKIVSGFKNKTSQQRLKELNSYIVKFPDSFMALIYAGNECFENRQYDEALKYYQRAAEKNSSFLSAKLNIAAVYRQQNKFGLAVNICNEVLKDNYEFDKAYISLSKIELKRKNYKKALEFIKKAEEFGDKDPSIEEVLCIVYHFNNMQEERDRAIARLKKLDKEDAEAIKEVFKGSRDYLE